MDPDRIYREHLRDVIGSICPIDSLEMRHLEIVKCWISSGHPLFRSHSKEVHLVSYALPWDSSGNSFLLGSHVKSGLTLPPGGHVESSEDPWDTAQRECLEELGVEAAMHGLVDPGPFFLTVQQTTGSQNQHIDVSLWYVVDIDGQVDRIQLCEEFSRIDWWTAESIRNHHSCNFDPNMARFLGKILRARA